MKVHLFQELLSPSQVFDHLIRGLERTEREPTYMKEMVRWAKPHVEYAQCADGKHDKPRGTQQSWCMETVDVKLPFELLRAANLDKSTLSGEAARLLALEPYREDQVSLGRAAGLSRTPVAAFMDFAANRGVPPLRYSFEDLEEERQTADRVKA